MNYINNRPPKLLKKKGFATTKDFWEELGKIVDLPENIKEATIYLKAGELVVIETTQLVYSIEGVQVGELNKRWELKETK